MTEITFIELDGSKKVVKAEAGLTLMEVAVRNNVQGIAADCGGQCSCATCHVHVDVAFFDKVGSPQDDEEDMLDFSDDRQPTSRLGCQVKITEELDGLIVNVAKEDA